MSTQRHKEKRLEEREGEKEHVHFGEREREKEHVHVGAEERERALWLLFLCFFLPPGPALCKLGLVRSAVLPEVLPPVLGPALVLLSRALPFLVF